MGKWKKELTVQVKHESRSTKESKGTLNPDVKSNIIENFNKSLTSRQKCLSPSSEDETESVETCIFCNTLYVSSKTGEGWIQFSGF